MYQRRNREKAEFIQEGHRAGREAFDKLIERLHYRNLYWTAQLSEDERTWTNMMSCTRTEPEEWEDEARDFDSDAFAWGFFERFQEVWDELEVRLSE